MSYQTDLNKDLTFHRKNLLSEIHRLGADACILSTAVNVFYMTGVVYAGYYYLSASGESFNFVKRSNDTEIENRIDIRKPEQILEILQERGIDLQKNILIETDTLPYSEVARLTKALNISKIQNASTLLRQIRSIKSEFEISQVRECANKHSAVYKLIPTLYRKGMTDIELQIEIERQMRLHGSMGIFRAYGMNMDIYMGSLLVGENAESPTPFDYALGGAGTTPMLPLGSCGIKIKDGNTIMVDMAGNYSPWMTDMTRTFSAGKTSDLAYKAHQISIDIHNEIKNFAKPGTPCADLYNIAYEIAKKNDLEANFMGTKQQAKFVGHGVGIEINEVPVLTPRSKEVLQENIIFALEPKFVIPSVGAVGIENTYLVRNSEIENLTIFEENIIEL